MHACVCGRHSLNCRFNIIENIVAWLVTRQIAVDFSRIIQKRVMVRGRRPQPQRRIQSPCVPGCLAGCRYM